VGHVNHHHQQQQQRKFSTKEDRRQQKKENGIETRAKFRNKLAGSSLDRSG
jgi:hypothetical protein